MPAFDPISLVAQLIPAGLQAGLGTFQYLSAINQAKKNVRPLYNINPEFQYNLDILKSSMGLPQSALDLYYRNANQNVASGISAINQTGGNRNNIASLVGNQNRNLQEILAMDAMQRKQDLGGIVNANLALAGEKDKAWQVNKFAPYADKAQAIAQEKVAGLNNIFGGFNSTSGAFANQATSKLADSLSDISTPNSGVNVNKISQSLMPTNKPNYFQSGGAPTVDPMQIQQIVQMLQQLLTQ